MTSFNWPAEIEEGLIPTDNAMGVMTRELSPAAEAFVQLAASAQFPLLDVGAAYGNATLPALRAGATVIAADLSASQLSRLANSTPVADRPRLIPLPARFPDQLPLADACLAGVLAAQVLHFLNGSQVEAAFQSVHRWLVPGGYFFALVMTPSLSYYRNLRSAYEERARQGERWPGIFDPRTVAPPEWQVRLPEMVNLFEKDVLHRCAIETGFKVESLQYFCFKHFPEQHRTDGREYISMIATKD